MAELNALALDILPVGNKLSESEFQAMKEQVFNYVWDSVRLPGA